MNKSYNDLMKVYSDRYYVSRNTDGIFVIVNHAAWKVLRNQPHDGPEVHIESYDNEGKRLLLTMIKGSVRLFNNRLKSTPKLVGEWEKSLSDDGGSLVFDSRDIHRVTEAFGIKTKQRRTPLSKERKAELREQLTRIRA